MFPFISPVDQLAVLELLQQPMVDLGMLLHAFSVLVALSVGIAIPSGIVVSTIQENRRALRWNSITRPSEDNSESSNKEAIVASNTQDDSRFIFLMSYIMGILTLNSDKITEAGMNDAIKVENFRALCVRIWDNIKFWFSHNYDRVKDLLARNRQKVVDAYCGTKSWFKNFFKKETWMNGRIYNSVWLPISNWNQSRLFARMDKDEDDWFAEGDGWVYEEVSPYNWIQRLLGMDRLIDTVERLETRCESLEQKLTEQNKTIARLSNAVLPDLCDAIEDLRENQFDPTEWYFQQIDVPEESVQESTVVEVEEVPDLTPEEIAEDDALLDAVAPIWDHFEASFEEAHVRDAAVVESSKDLRLKVDAAADRLLQRREQILETLRDVEGTVIARDMLERLRNMVREDEDLSEVIGNVDVYNAVTIRARILKALG